VQPTSEGLTKNPDGPLHAGIRSATARGKCGDDLMPPTFKRQDRLDAFDNERDGSGGRFAGKEGGAAQWILEMFN
jgi:hypothetical protein